MERSLPLLQTDRLLLRPWSAADVAELHALWTDPAVRRYLWDDVVIPRERAAVEVERSLASAARYGLGDWLLLSRADDALVGFCGLRRSESDTEAEILYALAPQWWGRGLATEACRAVLGYAFDTLRLERVIGITDVPNTASVRVLERLGMSFVERFTLNGLNLVRYSLERATKL